MTDEGSTPLPEAGAGTPAVSARGAETSAARRADKSNLLLGNPSRAGKGENNYLVEREAHAMSYNRSNGGPNWVAWYLDKADRDSAPRSDFMPDPLLPGSG